MYLYTFIYGNVALSTAQYVYICVVVLWVVCSQIKLVITIWQYGHINLAKSVQKYASYDNMTTSTATTIWQYSHGYMVISMWLYLYGDTARLQSENGNIHTEIRKYGYVNMEHICLYHNANLNIYQMTIWQYRWGEIYISIWPYQEGANNRPISIWQY